MACSRAGCASGAVTQTSMDRSISSLVRTKVNAISCRAARVRGDPPYSAIFAKRGDLPLRVLPDGSYQSTSLDFQRPILTSHREQKRGRNEGPQGAVWREGDVPIKVSGPHKALISRFELSTFPHPFPRDEGGTGIRKLGWHEPARLSTDHMRAAQGFGSLRRFVASQCDLAQGSDAEPAIGETILFYAARG